MRVKKKESNIFNPNTPYAISRSAMDLHLKRFNQQFNLPVVFTRTANVYGPGQQLYRIVPKSIFYSKKKKKLGLHGGGSSKRSFIYIDDVSDATYRVCMKGKLGETYHISTNQLMSIKNLLNKICKILNIKFNKLVNFEVDRIGKDNIYNLNSNKIRKELNWKPKVSLKDGLKITLKWIEDNLDNFKKKDFNYLHKK